MSKEFFENCEGVHLVEAGRGEFTICGDAFDIEIEMPELRMMPTKKTVVTCPNCITVIKHCRGVRISE